ncbi:hypothetical protein K1719_046372 [Acacia pycnantha]|nr:hypothetical protein K1719_046372 [Acacia pycnantha]
MSASRLLRERKSVGLLHSRLQYLSFGCVSRFMTSGHLKCLSVNHTHILRVGKVVWIGFQPSLEPGKIVNASQAGDIQFLDIRNHSGAYLKLTGAHSQL